MLEEVGDRAVVAAVDCTHAGSWGLEPLGPENMLVASLTDPDLLRGVCQLSRKFGKSREIYAPESASPVRSPT